MDSRIRVTRERSNKEVEQWKWDWLLRNTICKKESQYNLEHKDNLQIRIYILYPQKMDEHHGQGKVRT